MPIYVGVNLARRARVWIPAMVVVATVMGLPGGAVAAESDAELVIVGGPAVVSEALSDHLSGCADSIERISGRDRYATAAAIASHWETADTVIVATGTNFPDAIAGGPIAAEGGGPVLLTRPDAVPAATLEVLARLAPARIVVLGGGKAISTEVESVLASLAPEVIRIAGADRYGTAAALSAWRYPDGGPDVVYVASGTGYIDALVAGPVAARNGAPLLLTAPDRLPAATATELTRLAPTRIVIVGGPLVVGPEVEAQLGSIAPVERLAGATATATAAAAAADAPGSQVFVATSLDFPDGLAAIPLTAGAPILLVQAARLDQHTAGAIAARSNLPCVQWSPPYPMVGEGQRIIYSNSEQRVWLVEEDGGLRDTYLVSGRLGIPPPGTYQVFSKSVTAYAGHHGITMSHMVRFVPPRAVGNRLSIGFHGIPRYADGTPMQSEEELGTFQSSGCVRQNEAKAAALYEWAPIGTAVIVIP